MVPMRRLVAIAVLCPALAVAGCSAVETGNPPASDASSANSASPSPPPTDAAGLAALLRRGVSSVTSTHFTFSVSAAGQTLTGEGDQKLADGKVEALDLSEEIGSLGTVRIIIVDQSTYVQFPEALNQSDKPWVLVTQDSSNQAVRTMATLLESVQNSASLDQFAVFTTAASRVTLVGSESVDGTAVTHYSIDMDVTKLADTVPALQAAIDAGVTTVPVEMFVDGEGRPVKVVTNFAAQGQSASTVVTLSKFNEPVTITAPPADQVSTS